MKRRLASVFVAIVMIVCFGLEAEAHYHRHDYHFGARQYNAATMLWSSPDSKQEDYTPLSPLSYCAANPIRFIDPMGEDIWEIDEFGNMIGHVVNKTKDMFYIVDSDGSRIRDKKIIFKYGTIEAYKSQYVDKDNTRFDWFVVRGDENGTQLFEFFANNFRVEYSHLMLGQSGSRGLNVISTSHKINTDESFIYLFENQYKFGYTIRQLNHNHPINMPFPSGLQGNRRWGDIGNAQYVTFWAQKNNGSNPSFNLYLPGIGVYINYNQNSKITDFSEINPSIILPIFEVIGKTNLDK